MFLLPLWPKRGGPPYNIFPFVICIKRAKNYIDKYSMTERWRVPNA